MLRHCRLLADVAGLALGGVLAATWSRSGANAVWLAAEALTILAALTAVGRYGRPDSASDFRWWRPVGVALIVTSAFGVARLFVAEDTDAGLEQLRAAGALGAGLGAAVAILHCALRLMRASGRGLRATLILGSGRVARTVAGRLVRDRTSGLRPIGCIDDERAADGAELAELPVLGAVDDIEAVVARHRVECVVVAFGGMRDERVVGLVRRCWDLGVEVLIIPRLFELHRLRLGMHSLGRMPLQPLPPPRQRRLGLRIKDVLDRVIAAMAVLVLAPLLLGVWMAIRLTMGGPALFRQQRVGRDGRPFEMLKFRTMDNRRDAGAEADLAWAAAVLGTHAAQIGTPVERRCTRLGAFLRRTSVDELPQILNVLRGDMSLVGPRPERVRYAEMFATTIDGYTSRHRVKGGLTGWAQVHGLRGETSLHDRVEWDNAYIDNWSLWLDARIVWRTLPAVVRAARTTSPGAAQAVHKQHFRRPARYVRPRFAHSEQAPPHAEDVSVQSHVA